MSDIETGQATEAADIADAFDAFLARIELRRWPFTLHVRRSVDGYSHVRLEVIAGVRDRDTDEPYDLGFAMSLDPWRLKLGRLDDDEMLRIVLSLLDDVLRHEMRESLYLDGKRAVDLHAPLGQRAERAAS